MRSRGVRPSLAGVVGVLVVAGVGVGIGIGLSISVPAFAASGLWNAVSRAPADEAARERRQAQLDASPTVGLPGPSRAGRNGGASGRSGDGSARSEIHLRRALQVSPNDYEARKQLAELLASTGRPRDAAREFELARRVAPTPSAEARIWFRVANERSRTGAYDEALDAYGRQLALGDVDPAALSNSAELLMAVGRLPEAIDRYREALAIEERERDRRAHIQGLALGYFGLAVALDRDGREVAAREAMGRALALDAGLGVLRLAQQATGDLFFVPPGDVFYYLGLAREGQGRPDDAAAAFREYLRVPTARYAPRAREHLAEITGAARGEVRGSGVGGIRGGVGGGGAVAGPGSGVGGTAARPPRSVATSGAASGATRGVRLRVIYEATLQADGPLVAPMIDAAWRLDGRLLDECLSDVVASDRPGTTPLGPAREFRLSLELTIDETGRATAVKVEPPVELGTTLGPCIENAIRNRFRVTRPTRRKPTKARIELVLAPAGPSG